jgi:glutathione peroxidase
MSTLNYDISVKTLEGETGTLAPYRGRVILVVNTASHCGFTPQLEGLERLHQQFEDQGLSVLGFPSDSFMQESRDVMGVETVCRVRYGVTFPLHEITPVNGSKTHPLFVQLKEAARGFAGMRRIGWNYTKFLIGRDGGILKRYGAKVPPRSLEDDIKRALDPHDNPSTG